MECTVWVTNHMYYVLYIFKLRMISFDSHESRQWSHIINSLTYFDCLLETKRRHVIKMHTKPISVIYIQDDHNRNVRDLCEMQHTAQAHLTQSSKSRIEHEYIIIFTPPYELTNFALNHWVLAFNK